MRFGSVCSGIEAASVAWEPLGWQAAFLSEIEAFPRAVLAHHYPNVPLHGDFTTIQADQYGPIDLLVGGTPCQSFSVAGLRGGLADDRGNLALEYLRLADRLRPRWLVWENVPGVLSSGGGRDFGAFLGGLVELGYGFAYRVLDAQYFGLAQRRKRVFVVGYLGDWRRAAAVLFERESLRGYPAPSRKAGKDVAPTISARTKGGGGLGTDFDLDGGLIANTLSASRSRDGAKGVDSDCTDTLLAFGGNNATWSIDTCPTLRAGGNRTGGDRPPGTDVDTADSLIVARPLLAGGHANNPLDETLIAYALRGEGFDASEDGTGRGTPLVACEPDTLAIRGRDGGHDLEYRQDGVANAILTPNGGRGGIGVGAVAYRTSPNVGVWETGDRVDALTTGTDPTSHVVAFHENQRGELTTNDTAGSLKVGCGKPGQGYPAVQTGAAVRRLTPLECERLQGFPDGYTAVPYRGKAAADGNRYKALGNSFAVPVVRWIGRRIEAVEASLPLSNAEEAA